jgi:Ca2+/Na+ antiporter
MQSVYDWVTLAIFAGLVVLFLQRSTNDRREKDASLLFYLGAGIGCAIANYFGNHGQDLIAILLLAATVAFIFYFLRPFQRHSNS